jgi:hypothetical protein
MDLGQSKAFPLAAGRQALAASASKLVSQSELVAIFMPEDDWAKLTRKSVVGAEHLFSSSHRLFEQGVVRACH